VSKAQDQRDLAATDAQIKALTGDRFHLYTSAPTPADIRIVFGDGQIFGSYKLALAHARSRLIILERLVAEGVDVKGMSELKLAELTG